MKPDRLVTPTSPLPFQFGSQDGYWTQSTTGLMRVGHRYYDPNTGRFISRDPVQDGYNWYNYCGNDPVNCVDPTGEFIWVLVVLGLVAVALLTSGCNSSSNNGTTTTVINVPETDPDTGHPKPITGAGGYGMKDFPEVPQSEHLDHLSGE